MPLHPDFINELRKHFTGDIRNDLASRVLYSTDASIYQIEPLGIVIPRTQEDLQAAVELAAKYSVPILPRGSGSSLAGQAVGESLIIDCSRWLDRLIAVDAGGAHCDGRAGPYSLSPQLWRGEGGAAVWPGPGLCGEGHNGRCHCQ